MYFLGDHGEDDVGEFGLFYHWLQSDVVSSATCVFVELTDYIV